MRFLEEKHGVYRGEKYRLLLDREAMTREPRN